MKQFLPALLLLGTSVSCCKIEVATAQQPVSIKTDTVAGTINDDFMCFSPCITEAEFPGKTKAWNQFVMRHLVYPPEALDMCAQGTVVVQFIVNTDGTLSNIEALSGPELFKQCAIDVLKKSPKWVPAQLHGRIIKSYKREPFRFSLEDE
jgi:periplasmic protein TonB